VNLELINENEGKVSFSAAMQELHHPIGEQLGNKRVLVVADGNSNGKLARSFMEEAKMMAGVMPNRAATGLNKPVKNRIIKVPTTQADFDALEKARIKRETKQAKRLK
jgi:hypothetical protein